MCTKYITSYNCNHVLVHKNTTTATHTMYMDLSKKENTPQNNTITNKNNYVQSHHEQVTTTRYA